MLVGLSPKTARTIKFRSVAISSHLPRRAVNIVWIDKRCQLRRPISVLEHCKKPEIELNDASVQSARLYMVKRYVGKQVTGFGILDLVMLRQQNPADSTLVLHQRMVVPQALGQDTSLAPERRPRPRVPECLRSVIWDHA